ncbi:hypothetical protein B0A55_01332 [Friedmanniomyces simplex]|uniref:Uncharacterized protein n=1 Tax=Friedmanniomyces simplex TaxID=329884 RepID=A0A4U0XV13_9PEZI|nr:hypothetical protein B0A55_01332 [Friedmanniomyces simplex]
MTLTSVAPPHLPCGIPKPGETEQLMPHIGWVNAVPDAVASVDLQINGTALSFSGPGYHDKNCGDQPFLNSTASWYWGRGRLGPYSIVWFDARSLVDGEEYFSAYVARGGRMVGGGCVAGESVVVRPWGGDAAYPPLTTSADPERFELVFAEVEGREMRVNVKNSIATVKVPGLYNR